MERTMQVLPGAHLGLIPLLLLVLGPRLLAVLIHPVRSLAGPVALDCGGAHATLVDLCRRDAGACA
jgi:hypothetical protein